VQKALCEEPRTVCIVRLRGTALACFFFPSFRIERPPLVLSRFWFLLFASHGLLQYACNTSGTGASDAFIGVSFSWDVFRLGQGPAGGCAHRHPSRGVERIGVPFLGTCSDGVRVLPAGVHAAIPWSLPVEWRGLGSAILLCTPLPRSSILSLSLLVICKRVCQETSGSPASLPFMSFLSFRFFLCSLLRGFSHCVRVEESPVWSCTQVQVDFLDAKLY
jgi:hypothetical protein